MCLCWDPGALLGLVSLGKPKGEFRVEKFRSPRPVRNQPVLLASASASGAVPPPGLEM